MRVSELQPVLQLWAKLGDLDTGDVVVMGSLVMRSGTMGFDSTEAGFLDDRAQVCDFD